MRLPSPEVEEEGGQEERGEEEDAPSHRGNHVQFDRHLQQCICNVQGLPKKVANKILKKMLGD